MRHYNLHVKASPTLAGIQTKVTQRFDGTQLTDRYIKQLTNAIRHRIIPPFGGMYQIALMCAEHLGVQAPVGARIASWGHPTVVQGHGAPTRLKLKAWKNLMKLSSVRSVMKHSELTNIWKPAVAEKPEASSWGLHLPGWDRSERKMFIAQVHEATRDIPGYAEDMEKLAQFIESRPSFNVMDATLDVVVIKHRVATLAERKAK